MAKPAHHILDIYETRLHFAKTRTQVDRLREQLPHLPELDDDAAGSCLWAAEDPERISFFHVIVFIDVAALSGKPERLVNLCAHEATHAAMAILERAGSTTIDPEAEHPAYLTGWLAQWIWEHVA